MKYMTTALTTTEPAMRNTFRKMQNAVGRSDAGVAKTEDNQHNAKTIV